MWTHVGRVWTNGEQFLVLDRVFRAEWEGDDDQVDVLIELDEAVTAIPVGEGAAGIVATDGTVNDEGWLEVFQAGHQIAVIQASGDPYRQLLRDALAYPADDDHVGDLVPVPTGDLVLFSSALSAADEWPVAAPRDAPARWEPAHLGMPAPGGLRLALAPGDYRLRVRWMTELDDSRFARWLLSPIVT